MLLLLSVLAPVCGFAASWLLLYTALRRYVVVLMVLSWAFTLVVTMCAGPGPGWAPLPLAIRLFANLANLTAWILYLKDAPRGYTLSVALLSCCLSLCAVAEAFNPRPVLAEEKDAPSGKVVKAGDGKLTIKGKGDKEDTCEVAKDAKITCDGKECKLEDLKPGPMVKVTLKNNKATEVKATTK